MRKYLRLIPAVLMLCVAVTTVVYILRNGEITTELLLAWTPADKLLAACAMLVLFALKSQTIIVPYVVVAAVAGMVFDLPLALAVNAVGTVVCISIPYLIGRLSGGAVTQKAMKKYAKLRRIYENNLDRTFLVSMLLRVLNMSNDLLGLLFGSLKISYAEFLVSSFVGTVPLMVLSTIFGGHLTFLSAPVLICTGAYALCAVAAVLLLGRRRRHKQQDGETGMAK